MALPSEYRTDRLSFLELKAKKYKINELDNLTNDDFLLLGKYIQMYCFMELNIQRLFNELKSKELVKINKKDKINIPYIINKLISVMESDIVELSKTDDVVAKLQEIKFRRDYRNIFAHWAAKRIPNEDSFIFFTGDNQDYKKIHKKNIEPEMISYAIFDIADIRGLIVHLIEYEEWIAHFCSNIYNKNNDEAIIK